MSSPLYFMAEIKIVITFKESVQMESEHITTCVEFWTRGWRIAYKTCSCVFQFLGPVILVVSLKDGFLFKSTFFILCSIENTLLVVQYTVSAILLPHS